MKEKALILLLHNRQDSGLYNYAKIYNDSYPESTLLILSDLYPTTSQWKILLFFRFYKSRILTELKNKSSNHTLIHICDNPSYLYKILNLLKFFTIPTIITIHDPQQHSTKSLKFKVKNTISTYLLNRSYQCSKYSPIKFHLHFEWDIKSIRNKIILPHPIYHVENITQTTSQRFTIGFFGRLEYYKGFDIFLQILNELDKSILNKQVVVLIAGKGDEATLIPKFQNLQIEFYNHFVEDAFFNELIKRSDIILLPYRQASQSGILMKAITYNKPTIVNNLPELNCYVEDGITGFIIDIQDRSYWIIKILSLIENSRILQDMSENLSTYKKQFLPETIAFQLYEYATQI